MTPETLLLCTDLDRTVLPNGTQPESPQARRCFSRFVSECDVILVYVTGRDKSLVQRAMLSYRLPTPAFVISDVGTNIHDLRMGDWHLWREWQQEIGRDWKGRGHQDLRQLLRDIDALRLQEHVKQNTYKLSFYFSLSADVAALRRTIETRLSDAGVDAAVIFSIDEPGGVGLLDIVPRRATKLHAVEFLQDYLSIPLDRVLFAGDSGNDLPVLTSRIPAVLVANAMHSVIEEAVSEARKQHNDPALYVARGGYLDMNGNYSAGILEGIAHYHPDLRERLATIEADRAGQPH